MTLNERIAAFEQLSGKLQDTVTDKFVNVKLKQQIEQEYIYNPWFIPIFVQQSIFSIVKMIDGKQIESWIQPYKEMISEEETPLRVGVIMPGNIPLAGFHDFISVLISGHTFIGKLSSNDAHLLPIIAEMLCEIEPRFKSRIIFCPHRIRPIDMIIATGSNHTASHFSYYFQKYPSVIRKHCNSIAILDGSESDDELLDLADDIFLYFGLGCRNVSKIYVPTEYSFNRLFSALDVYKDIISQHHKYLNNLEYQKTVHLLNVIPFLDQGIVMFKEDTSLDSPIGIVHYQYYKNMDTILKETNSLGDALQCISSNSEQHNNFVRLGETQFPKLNDYANGIDTLLFLRRKSV